MGVAAQDPQVLAVDSSPPTADALDVLGLSLVAGGALREGRWPRGLSLEPGRGRRRPPRRVDVLDHGLFGQRENGREGGEVVARPAEPQAAVRRGRRRGRHRQAADAPRHGGGSAPTVRGHRGDVEPPVLGVGAGALHCPHQKTDPAPVVDGQLRAAERRVRRLRVVQAPASREERPEFGSGGGDLVAIENADSHRALAVEHRARLTLLVDQKSLVLAPAGLADLVGDPDPVRAIDGDAGPGLEERRRRDRLHRSQAVALEAAEEDVVVAAVVAVPGDPGGALRIESQSRGPVVVRALGYPSLR